MGWLFGSHELTTASFILPETGIHNRSAPEVLLSSRFISRLFAGTPRGKRKPPKSREAFALSLSLSPLLPQPPTFGKRFFHSGSRKSDTMVSDFPLSLFFRTGPADAMAPSNNSSGSRSTSTDIALLFPACWKPMPWVACACCIPFPEFSFLDVERALSTRYGEIRYSLKTHYHHSL